MTKLCKVRCFSELALSCVLYGVVGGGPRDFAWDRLKISALFSSYNTNESEPSPQPRPPTRPIFSKSPFQYLVFMSLLALLPRLTFNSKFERVSAPCHNQPCPGSSPRSNTLKRRCVSSIPLPCYFTSSMEI